MTRSRFDLESKLIGALPLVNHLLGRLQFENILKKHLPEPDPRVKLAPAEVLGILARDLVLARVPLYAVGEWAQQRVSELLGIAPEQVEFLNDDRVGRALDCLFDADRQVLLTELVVQMVKEFKISMQELHNDSTTLTLHGQYQDATGKRVRGKPTVVITQGHNKDHRPDLKQLVWILTVSTDGAVPVHFKVVDGNTEDSTTHIETWKCLCLLVGSPEFLYVADSKLCTRENMKTIADGHGKFITVMPRSRKEDGLFKEWLQTNNPAWVEVARKPHPRLKNGPPDIFKAIASPIPDPDGFRVIWYHSSHKSARDAQARENIIQAAWKELQQLKAKLEGPRSRFQSRGSVARAADAILGKAEADRWISYEIENVKQASFRKEKRGRPGEKSRWRRQIKTRFRITCALREDQIAQDARLDGLFPLITNCTEEYLSNAQVLKAYKSNQPLVEKRHDLLKNVEAATPIYLKSVSRIEALLFVLFVALLVHALIERQIRKAMNTHHIREIALYPEERPCRAPSTERILDVFENLQRHVLCRHGEMVQRFDPQLTEIQLQVLELLGIDLNTFLG
jgi:transposase